MDDPNAAFGERMAWKEANRRILGALEAKKIKAALFVCGHRVDVPEANGLIREWDESGHAICSHSYSHLFYPNVAYAQYAADFLKNERVVAAFRNRKPIFRYPFLKEGDTAKKRDRFRALLKEHGYTVGHVTIDASDWYVDQRIRLRQAKELNAKLEAYRDFLIAHLLDRAGYYRNLAKQAIGREIPHTLLVHYSYMNALFLADVLDAFEKAGWQWITADEAYRDEVFHREPKIVPAGESLVWALAKESGKFEKQLRYPGEDGDYEKPKMDSLGL
jgi:hypothetical protein